MQVLINDLILEFSSLKSWEDRYRKLIQYSKNIPNYTEDELNKFYEISGCENRLWMQGNQHKGHWCFIAYSEARIMRGILAIILLLINNQDSSVLRNIKLIDILKQLNIAENLTQTRLKSIENINSYITQLVN